ncbi:hypothetical protein GYMLUDRAFT_64027 [Collybiopsis luxurians FD-317 M1]|uniref:Unplaced genomic scaffold GYMLUscaffold_88, whole genome shotgun sequence n=1 Tax=Collybiopsis luxurians FD-317 M1 TaxID=944289 RepID=A0A0D0BTM4_9AGAR|nr:hypothetical protein GYMLUDRAFT_64027 [Collybiopsis luxurians FD-317 M1]
MTDSTTISETPSLLSGLSAEDIEKFASIIAHALVPAIITALNVVGENSTTFTAMHLWSDLFSDSAYGSIGSSPKSDWREQSLCFHCLSLPAPAVALASAAVDPASSVPAVVQAPVVAPAPVVVPAPAIVPAPAVVPALAGSSSQMVHAVGPGDEAHYIVTVGKGVGVFQDVALAQSLVSGVSGGCFKKYPSLTVAQNAFLLAANQNLVHTVRPQ